MDQPYPPQQMPLSPPPPKSGLAIASLVCGILGLPTCGLTGIAAVITGHMALSGIKRAGGMVGGKGLAIGGLVTGYISVLVVGISFLAGLAAPVILKQRHAADRTAKMTEMQEVARALAVFKSDHGSYPKDLMELEKSGEITDLDAKLSVRSMYAGDWLYFTNPDGPSPSDEALLISPDFGKKHVVIFRDTSLKTVPEDEVPRLTSTGTFVKIPAPIKKR